MELEIGCGPQNRWIPNTLGIDKIDFGQKYVGDFLTYKFKDKFTRIFAHHVCEHIVDLSAFFDKCGRLLEPNGLIDIRVPTYPYPQAFQDPTHVHFPTDNFFDYFTEKSPAGHSYTDQKFEIVAKARDRAEWELCVVLKKL